MMHGQKNIRNFKLLMWLKLERIWELGT